MTHNSVLIVNKHARIMRKKRKDFIKHAKHQYDDLKIITVTGKKLKQGISSAANSGYKRIVVCGGDGTVATAAHLLSKTDIELGIVPGGTTNSFARNLKLSLDINIALKDALTKKSRLVNLASAGGFMFIGIASLGISESVASTIPDLLKKVMGRMSYLLWGVYKIPKEKAFEVEITYDNKKEKLSTFQLIIANSRLNGSLPIAQSADFNDDKIIVISFGKEKSKLSHVKNYLGHLSSGSKNSKNMVVLKGREFHIKTKPVRQIDVDGEVVGSTPATFKLEKEALSLVY